MTNRSISLIVLFASLAGFTGCAIPAPPVDFEILSTEPTGFRPEILERNVEGSDCPWVPFALGDFARAMDRALGKVPGGNVMTDVSFYTSSRPFAGLCVTVRGDVGSM